VNQTGKISKFVIKIFILTLILFSGYSVAPLISGLSNSQASSSIPYLLLVSFLQVTVISYPILKSDWSGIKLILSTFVIFYGITTLLTQIETLVFLDYFSKILPPETVPKLFLQGTVVAAIFSPMAVIVHGKIRVKPYGKNNEAFNKVREQIFTLTWKFSVIAIIYVLIYISFGMFVFIPLAGEAFQQYYSNLQLPAWIIPFQLLRGTLWGAIAYLIIRMMKGSRREVAITVAFIFSVLMGSLLLLPNPYMPEKIRLAHFVEVSTSNFLFGFMTALIFTRKEDNKD